MATDTDTHVHKSDPSNPGFCRRCGEPMPGSEDTIVAAFEASPPAGAVASTGLACLRCGAVLIDGSVCCEACGLPVAWTAGRPRQQLPTQAPAMPAPGAAPPTAPPVAPPTVPPVAPPTAASVAQPAAASVAQPAAASGAPPAGPPVAAPAVPSVAPAGVGHLKLVVRINRDIHDRAAHPEYPAPYDLTAYTFEIDGPRAELGRPTGEPAHDAAPNRILARDDAVSSEHATFERLPDGTWEIRDHSRNGTRLNHAKLSHHDASEPAGVGATLTVGDVVWAGYYTEIELVELA
jgi:hypothetical protein